MSAENHTAPPTGAEAEGNDHGPSRRSLLRGAAGFAGAGLAATVVAGAVAGPALASAADSGAARSAERSRPAGEAGHGAPVVVHVRDAHSGEMEIFSGTSQVKLRDPQLASKLIQAVR
jgi:hypothetical protein